MSGAVSVAEYKAELRKQKQMPKEKAALVAWLERTYGGDVIPEYRFHPHRRWRFDWAIPELTDARGKISEVKVAVEYDGLYGGAGPIPAGSRRNTQT
jgi:hypothetical protein